MYGLKPDIDLSILTGRELSQVAISLYSAIFRFDLDVAISIEGTFLYFDGKTEWTWKHQEGSCFIAARTVALLGATIESFERNTEGTLALIFSNGHRLTMVDDSKQFESYDITWPGHNVIV
jgi:Family of unknown function (DUF6188)